MGLFRRRRKRVPGISREQSLSAHPQHNPGVEVFETDDGLVRLSAAYQRRKATGWLAWLMAVPSKKYFTLDEIGSQVWRWCDGTRTVRTLADELAKRYKVNRREAEQAVNTYLKQLMQRSLILMEVDKPES